MKQGLKFFILTVILIAVMVGAYFAYQNLKGDGVQITKASSVQAQEKESADSGAKAADFKVVDANGNDVRLSEKFGKPLVVNFWASWCTYCVKELPSFESVYREKAEKVEWMMVNLTDGDRETLKSANAFLSEQDYTFPVYFDSYAQALNAYEAYSIPVTLFINSDGTLAEKHLGMLSQKTLEEKISELY